MAEDNGQQAKNKAMTDAVDLASDVVNDARKQWSSYRDRVVGVTETIATEAKGFGGATAVEKEMLAQSAKAAASVADVLINFAEAAFESMGSPTQDTRRKAARLVRNVVKLAVDDGLDNDSRPVPRTTRMLELVANDPAWQTIYLPRIHDETALIRLTGQLDLGIDVRPNPREAPTLRSGAEAEILLKGVRPSLSLRLTRGELAAPQAGVVTLHWLEPNPENKVNMIPKEIVLSILAVPAAAQ